VLLRLVTVTPMRRTGSGRRARAVCNAVVDVDRVLVRVRADGKVTLNAQCAGVGGRESHVEHVLDTR
jgi:hypothetical protein